MYLFFVEDGEIDKKLFLNSWVEIPKENESQYQITMNSMKPINSDQLSKNLKANNIFTIAKRTVEGQDMLYQSMKLSNGIWALAELKITPGSHTMTVFSLNLILFEL